MPHSGPKTNRVSPSPKLVMWYRFGLLYPFPLFPLFQGLLVGKKTKWTPRPDTLPSNREGFRWGFCYPV